VLGSVAWISIAPVKGLALASPSSVVLTERGVLADRRFHLIDGKGRLTNAKRLGKLLQLRADWDESTRRLGLHGPDGLAFEDEVRVDGEVETSFYGRPVQGRYVLGGFDDFLSDFVGEPLRIVHTEPGEGIDRGGEGTVTLLSTAALEPLAQIAGAPVRDARRFRMLFGVDGVEAHAEDGWIDREVRIGEALVIPRGHVGRCLITSRNPDTGRPDADTLGALRSYRGDLDSTEPLPFGVYGEVVKPGQVAVGDPVATV
jgi:MOSC domain-containing protein